MVLLKIKNKCIYHLLCVKNNITGMLFMCARDVTHYTRILSIKKSIVNSPGKILSEKVCPRLNQSKNQNKQKQRQKHWGVGAARRPPKKHLSRKATSLFA